MAGVLCHRDPWTLSGVPILRQLDAMRRWASRQRPYTEGDAQGLHYKLKRSVRTHTHTICSTPHTRSSKFGARMPSRNEALDSKPEAHYPICCVPMAGSDGERNLPPH